MTCRYAGLILAAGLSSRMGKLKPLLPFLSGNVLETTTACLLDACISEIYVVLGHEADLIRNDYRFVNDAILVYNDEYAKGMFTSVQAGVRAMDTGITAFLLTPADCPLVRPDTVRKVMIMHESTQKSIIRPTYQGRPGHPILVSLRYRDEILGGDFPQGMRSLIRRHQEDALSVPTGDEAVLWDMDTPEQYELMLQQNRSRMTEK